MLFVQSPSITNREKHISRGWFMPPEDRYKNRLILVHNSGQLVEQVLISIFVSRWRTKRELLVKDHFSFQFKVFLMTFYIWLCTECVYSSLSEQSPGQLETGTWSNRLPHFCYNRKILWQLWLVGQVGIFISLILLNFLDLVENGQSIKRLQRENRA